MNARFISNQNGTGVLILLGFDIPHQKFGVRLCTCISEITLGALIGVDALNRANVVICIFYPVVDLFHCFMTL